jgi:hypothetical protein
LKKTGHWIPGAEYSDLRHYFRNWELLGAKHTVKEPGVRLKDPEDPHPRVLWTLHFRSEIQRKPLEWFELNWKENDKVDFAKLDLAKKVAEFDNIDVTSTDYYSAWVDRKKGSWSDEQILKFCADKLEMMYDIKYYGLNDPLLVQASGKVTDGGHRFCILQALGYTSALCRII